MTFNLLTSTKKQRTHPWRLRRRSIARIFRRYAPDVIGTQEANLPQLLELAELLPEYEFLGEGNLGQRYSMSADNWYSAIFYRWDKVRPTEGESDAYWLSPTPDVPASQFHLGTRPRVATWQQFEHLGSGRNFLFGTTHLEAANSRHRRKSAALLREYIDRKVAELGDDIPVFLTGDFNAVENSREIRTMRSQARGRVKLYDVWDRASTDAAGGATFRGMGLRDRVGRALMGPRRIDYVFYRPDLKIRSVTRVDFDALLSRECTMPSDHYPVLAEFQLAG
jgi:endonuclease/exonuclease/phosphatase family metal-dependent hydrolase